MDLKQEIIKLLKTIGPGHMMTTAYDTAWVARLAELGEPIGEQALEWLREHQLLDGSWGAPQPEYFHDRVICTLAAIIALARQGDAQDRERLRRAEIALSKAARRLSEDVAGETIGFEMIAPTLLNEAKILRAVQSEELDVLNRLTPRWAAKLAALPEGVINRNVTLAFSAEMAGLEGRELIDADNVQEPNGSVSYSPSATAYFALNIRRRDPAALAYLRGVAVDGAVPNIAPFDVFEPAWVLWNLSLLEDYDSDLLAFCNPHLHYLESAWEPDRGVGAVANFGVTSSDETSVVYETLTHYGVDVNPEILLSFEEEHYFRCFALEANPSVSANIHVLSALKKANFAKQHTAVQKILNFLRSRRTDDMFWVDKWHASPYYATSHAIMACVNYDETMARQAVAWMLTTQNKDGSWGYYAPTAEETAYSLQALIFWQRYGGKVPHNLLKRAAHWLEEHKEPEYSGYPPLWIGKCLYSPEMVVRSAVLSALMMAQA